ncbi:MAG: prolyl oligopeptidase family serine peptidase [Planctomycetota bacterium]
MLDRFVAAIALCVCAFPAPLAAQGSEEDYARARGFRRRFEGLTVGLDVQPQWLSETELWCLSQSTDGDEEVVLVDTSADTDSGRRVLATGRELRQRLGLERVPRIHRLERIGEDFWMLIQPSGDSDPCGVVLRSSGEVEAADPFDVSAFYQRHRQYPFESPDGAGETVILFVNPSDDPVEINWLPRRGSLRSYGVLQPGERRWQHTFVGHQWELVRQDGRGEMYVVGEPSAGIASPIPLDDIRDSETTTSLRTKPRRIRWGRGPGFREDDVASPDGQFRVESLSGDVFVVGEPGVEVSQLTSDASERVSYSSYAESGFWSPDSQSLVVVRTTTPPTPVATVIHAGGGSEGGPRVINYGYPRPGDAIRSNELRLFVKDGEKFVLRSLDLTAFENAWSIDQVGFDADGSRCFFRYNQRGHRVLRVSAIDGRTGEIRTLVEEAPDTFVDYNSKSFSHWVGAKGDALEELVWMSERSGFNHLYLVDAREDSFGELRPITAGEWPVFDVRAIDDENRTILFTAGGMYPDQDPYHVHYGRVAIDTGEITWLTEGDGTHEIEFSPNGEFYFDRYSRVDLPTVTELRRTNDGSLIAEIHRGDDSALRAAGWSPPQRFVAKGRDGETDIWGIVHRPTNFDPQKRYPVIESIYAGPHGQHVPKSFRVHRRQAELAELGFIVVQIDGMGTNRRSKAFHDVCWKNLGDAGFPDRIAWMRALAETDPSVDLERVGIYGGSAGGQNAMRALIAHNDFYDAAVADCGCHDNRVDKIWWNELWMSWPLGPHYDESSNVVQAHRLEGDLLLTVGGIDRNVDPASTMQVVDALIAADKDFELLVFPSAGHGAGESTYGVRRRRDFFVRKLLGVEPRWR